MENSLKLKLKKARVLYKLSCIFVGISAILLLGTAGSLECDTIGLGQAIIRIAIFGALAWFFGLCAYCYKTRIKVIKNRIVRENARIARNRAQIIAYMKNDFGEISSLPNA